MKPAAARILLAACLLLPLAACGASGGGDGARKNTTTTAGDGRTTTTTEPDPEGEEREQLEGNTMFSDSFDDDDAGWVGTGNYDDAPVAASISDGNLLFSGKEAGGLDLWPDAIADQASDIGDQKVTATVAVTDGGAISVVCRLDPEGEYPKQYSFVLSSSGAYSILKYDGTSFDGETIATNPPELLEGIEDGTKAADMEIDPAFDYSEDEEYDITGQCVDGDDGVELTMYVDDEQVLATTDDDDPLETGLGGLGAQHTLVGRDDFTKYGAAAGSFEIVVPADENGDDNGGNQNGSDEDLDGTEIGVGRTVASDPLTTPGALGFPTSGEGAEYRFSQTGFTAGLTGGESGLVAPVAGAVKVPKDGVAVAADVRGVSLGLGVEDKWGVVCGKDYISGDFYAFVAQPDYEVDDRYTVQILRRTDDGLKVLAEGSVDSGGSLFNVGGACVPRKDGGTQLAMSFGDERVLGAIDEDGLAPGAVGVFLLSRSGTSGTEFSNFLVTEAELA